MVKHIPVLLQEIQNLLRPHPGTCLVDGTFGGGGHARALIPMLSPSGTFIGIDRDAERIQNGVALVEQEKYPTTHFFFHTGSYADLPEFLTTDQRPFADMILLDLGFSSFHIDDPNRGFSFQHMGPLDMRYDQSNGMTAADVVNSWGEDALTEVIRVYGEESAARPIAKAICFARRQERIYDTARLAEIISHVKRSMRGKIHPATKTFQALRIVVNDEMGELKKLLTLLPTVLAPQGRIAVISFHGLEDKVVKSAFTQLIHEGKAVALTKKPITPSEEECFYNPRARSAKLRGIQFI